MTKQKNRGLPGHWPSGQWLSLVIKPTNVQQEDSICSLPLFPENKPILLSHFGSSLTQYNNLPLFSENKPILSSHFGSSLTQYNNLPLFSENKPNISHFGSSLTQYNNLPLFSENKPILSSHFGSRHSSLTQYNNLPLFSENKPILSSHFGSSLTQYNTPLCALMNHTEVDLWLSATRETFCISTNPFCPMRSSHFI